MSRRTHAGLGYSTAGAAMRYQHSGDRTIGSTVQVPANTPDPAAHGCGYHRHLADPIAINGPQVCAVNAASAASVPAKRNLALGAARGTLVAWFDDDPRRLSILVQALASGARLASANESWLVDPVGRRAHAYRSQGDVIFKGLAVPLADVADLRSTKASCGRQVRA